MRVQALSIPQVLLVTPDRFADKRGFLSETFQAKRFAEIGIDAPFAHYANSAYGDYLLRVCASQ